MKKVSIIGLGWIGLPLARILKAKGISCMGSTTSPNKATELQQQGIDAFPFELNPYPKGQGFHQLFDAETIVVNIPPRSRTQSPDFYLEQLKFLKGLIINSEIQHVLFVSSTGIYPTIPREKKYSEEEVLTLDNSGNPNLLRAEQLLEMDRTYDYSIIRFGGLMGEDRIPLKYFSGKEDVAGNTRVNFIHQLDAALMMEWIIEKSLWNETFNGVAPLHPKRKEIYKRIHQDFGIPLPKSFQKETEENNRLISSEKILQTGFAFQYPDPLEFPYSAQKS
ncbi:epimerase [Algoriphagus sp. CAU 1675]|uniref:epimerase n=1 Tax=Algoriphagus sp. CAU 1675 TaxID=3032597 RepID=UPI0023D99595|nr:epimerase [Algoriphagus sp. CAU 1675]MDF2158761.1 epimerase [Algoriphagus sp. CAU 1675]